MGAKDQRHDLMGGTNHLGKMLRILRMAQIEKNKAMSLVGYRKVRNGLIKHPVSIRPAVIIVLLNSLQHLLPRYITVIFMLAQVESLHGVPLSYRNNYNGRPV